ncbi:phosphatase PAP2 family protein [uncultured Clostridium sp.]|uniref:phosphatase PAP2 family protein n=1 Tax=uncultured Clostridium sp. TaxID=59620 RepID=UPI0028E996AC|nr:phosphatase PAP2 family protein [uncultured Clostridium sp.]
MPLISTIILPSLAMVSLFILLNFYKKKEKFSMDIKAINYVKNIENEKLYKFFKIATTIGDPTSIVIMTIVVCFFCYRNNYFKESMFFFMNIIGVWLFNELLKLIYRRERPSIKLFKVRGYSLPSGHAMVFMAYSIISMYFIFDKIGVNLITCIISGIIVILNISVGLSRVYFRVHYLSDVIAGWYAGIVWMCLSIPIYKFYY